jgi:SAM-dependent methyltransferase
MTFISRIAPQLRRYPWFATGGALGLAIVLVLTYILTESAHFWYFGAYIISTFCAWTFNFYFNSKVTFRGHLPGDYLRKYARFMGMYILAFVLNAGAVYVLVSVVGVHYLIAITIVSVLISFLTFFISKQKIFHYQDESSVQEKHDEWAWQWKHLEYDSAWLFSEWIYPNTVEMFRGKKILDCGCGGGQQMALLSPIANSITGVDLNMPDTLRKRMSCFSNIKLYEGDIASMDLADQFDIVYSIGVLHHTDAPDVSFRNILRHCKPNGRVIVWVYSYEGNFINRTVLEWIKRDVLMYMPRATLLGIAHVLTTLLYIPIYTVYLLPLTFLPFFEYFQNWRQLPYQMNALNVFDKLNAPQTHFINEAQIKSWFDENHFNNITIERYRGVSWRASGTKKLLSD